MHWFLDTGLQTMAKAALGTLSGLLVGRVLFAKLVREWREHLGHHKHEAPK